MMRITTYDGHGLHDLDLADHELPRFFKANEHVLWIDVDDPSLETMAVLRDMFDFHPLAIEDTRNQFQRPKVEEYSDHLFIIVNNITRVRHDLDYQELDIFLGATYLVTVHRHCAPVIKEVRDRLQRAAVFKHVSSGYLLYVLLDTVVDAYFPILDMIEDEIEDLSERALTYPTQNVVGRLFQLRRMLNECWRIASQQRDMFIILTRREQDLLINHEVLEYYLRDVYDHLLRITDLTSSYRDNLTSVVDLYLSASSNRVNMVVNRLAVITIVIGILTVVSGFYGMNFETTWPPFLHEGGVLFVLLLMGALTIGALGIFRYLKWF